MSTIHRRISSRPHRRFLAAALAIATSAGLVVCSSGTGEDPATSGAAGEPTESAGTGEAPIEYEDFTFTSWSYAEETSKAIIEADIAPFAEKAGVKIDLASYPFSEYVNQLLLRSRDGSTTGAAQLDIANLGTFVKLGVLADLSEVADDIDFTEAALRNGQVDGVQYGLPWYTGSIGLVANSQLLEQAGIDEIPTTVEDFEAALKAVKALGGDHVPYALATKPEAIKDFMPWFRTFGSKIVDGDQVAVNDAGAVQALEWFTHLYQEGLVTLNIGRPEARTLFGQGKAAFFDDANSVIGVIKAQAADPALLDHTVPVPRPVVKAGDQPQALAWGGLIVVFNQGPTATATEFATYYTSSTDIALNRFEKLGMAPTLAEAVADEAFTSDAWNSTWQTASTENASPNPLWQFTNFSQMETILAEEIQAAMTGQRSAQDALDAAQAKMQELAAE